MWHMKCRYCIYNSLDVTKVNGTIVVCDNLNDGTTTLDAGATGTIMQDGGNKDFAFSFPLPVSYLSTRDGTTILNYINSTRYVQTLEQLYTWQFSDKK